MVDSVFPDNDGIVVTGHWQTLTRHEYDVTISEGKWRVVSLLEYGSIEEFYSGAAARSFLPPAIVSEIDAAADLAVFANL